MKKKFFGVLLIIAGAAMLVLPGPGSLTLLWGSYLLGWIDQQRISRLKERFNIK